MAFKSAGFLPTACCPQGERGEVGPAGSAGFAGPPVSQQPITLQYNIPYLQPVQATEYHLNLYQHTNIAHKHIQLPGC